MTKDILEEMDEAIEFIHDITPPLIDLPPGDKFVMCYKCKKQYAKSETRKVARGNLGVPICFNCTSCCYSCTKLKYKEKRVQITFPDKSILIATRSFCIRHFDAIHGVSRAERPLAQWMNKPPSNPWADTNADPIKDIQKMAANMGYQPTLEFKNRFTKEELIELAKKLGELQEDDDEPEYH